MLKNNPMWPFKTKRDDLEARILQLEAKMGVFSVDYNDAVGKLTKIAMRVEERYRVQEGRANADAEKEELRGILGGLDVAAILKDPAALQAALSNPAVINFALKKLGKEL